MYSFPNLEYGTATCGKVQFKIFFFFGQEACRISVPPPGIKPSPSAVEAQNLNHWTAREVLRLFVCVSLCNAPNTQHAAPHSLEGMTGRPLELSVKWWPST